MASDFKNSKRGCVIEMKQMFSQSWVSSSQPRKQRKYRHNLPAHLHNRMLSSPLSGELRKRLGIRSIPVRKDDTVSISKGSFRGKTGKVNSVNTKSFAVYVDGVESSRRDGTRVFVPVKASNVVIVELSMEDRKRIKNGKKSP